MGIEKVRVEGFRLLQDVEITLEGNATVIVGRNNSGKTSLTDVFDRLVSENGPSFRLQDFSAATRRKFYDAKVLKAGGGKSEDVLALLPRIVVTLTFSYEKEAPDLGPLAPFVIDLVAESSTVVAKIEYAATLKTVHSLLDTPTPDEGVDPRAYFYRCLKDTLPRAYSIQVSAVDPTDPNNVRQFDGVAQLNALTQCSLVRAQRTLDHAKHGDADVIGKLLGKLFKTASAPTAAAADQELAARLKASVEAIERGVQDDFDMMLTGLFPAMDVIGFPGTNDSQLRPETSLDVEKLLNDHTKIVYAGSDGIHLPEGYNGLGTRNLIYMLLQLESFHKEYRARSTRPFTHLVFIEEPEAHLHPQMQEVFINQLNVAVKKLSENYPEEPAWKVQFVITTHSPHVANAAAFEAVRYFLNEPPTDDGNRRTKVKDFKKGVSVIPPNDREFLHQYMTLTKCDLYFADKAIMVEGTTERILMPRLCAIVDQELDDKHKLARQYVTTIEVGGAYAHLFYPLVDFLELKTLIITDIDAVKAEIKTNKKGQNFTSFVKCPVSSGERTSNVAIREWFRPDKEKLKENWQNSPPPQVTPQELAKKTDADKTKKFRRIAYQIPEDPSSSVCARSYEDALVLANPERFEWEGVDDKATEAWEIAKDLPKTETALRFAIQETAWKVPRYIREGLKWLSEPPPPPTVAPAIEHVPDAPNGTAA